jgi:hypothetical protein
VNEEQAITDADLGALAESSSERAERSDAHPPATLGDVFAALENARAASEARGTVPESETEARRIQLFPVLNRLPALMLRLPRATVESLIDPVLLDAVSGWKWGDGNILLAGRTRVGKTMAAVHLVRRLIQEGIRHGGEAFELAKMIRWQECRELSAAAREYKLGTGSPEEIIGCKLARLLILDDLGAHDEREGLDRILQFRLTRGWPTITTTGLRVDGPQGLDATFGEHFTVRLLELGSDKGMIFERLGA